MSFLNIKKDYEFLKSYLFVKQRFLWVFTSSGYDVNIKTLSDMLNANGH